MKWIIALLTLLSLILPISANDDSNSFTFKQQINTNNSTSEYYSITLTADHYRLCNKELTDIRVVDATGAFCPYLIHSYTTNSIQENISYPIQLIRQGSITKDEQYSYFYEFQIINNSGSELLTINSLQLETGNQDYSYQVSLSGRSDKGEWNQILKDSVYHIKDTLKNNLDIITIQNYKFYRLEFNTKSAPFDDVTLSAGLDRKKVSIQKFTKVRQLNFSSVEKNKKSYITIENNDQLKISKICIKTESKFKREVYLKNKKHLLQNDSIYNFIAFSETIVKKQIDLDQPSSAEVLTLIIENGDDQPITIDSLEVEYLYDKVIFRPSKNPPFYLLYGDALAKTVSYDIEQYREAVLNSNIFEVSLAATEENKNIVSFTQNSELLFSIIVIVTSLIFTGFIIIFLLKKKSS